MTAQQELNTYREAGILPERLTKRFLRLLNERELKRLAKTFGPEEWEKIKEPDSRPRDLMIARYLRVQEVRREKGYIKDGR